MAREEQAREDLLREATALVQRIEMVLGDNEEPLVIGFRANGAASIYFGSDPVYHFTAGGELRRAYIQGLLYKSENRQLVAMRRQRTPAEVQLLRHELDKAQQAAVVDALGNRLARFLALLDSGDYKITGQVPADQDLIARVRHWLQQMTEISVARSPAVQ